MRIMRYIGGRKEQNLYTNGVQWNMYRELQVYLTLPQSKESILNLIQ